MLRKFLSPLLACMLVQTFIFVKPVRANSNSQNQSEFVQKMRKKVLKLGVGKDARVSVKLFDNTKVQGYISRADEESFVIADAKTGTVTTISYSNVGQVKGRISKGYWVMTGAIVVSFLLLLIYDRTLSD